MENQEEINDPIQLLAHCNRHIRKLEMYIALSEKSFAETNDPKFISEIAKLEGHLVKWTEEAEHAIHQAFQQGKTKTDVSTASKKKMRVNAER